LLYEGDAINSILFSERTPLQKGPVFWTRPIIFNVSLYWTNEKQVDFRVNRTRNQGSSDEELIRLISNAAK
tara:strand:- start:137 stop:349 length:213 start_codon:yes stop_codon:yes gene_type:complete